MKMAKNFVEFDLVGIDASIANSIRRTVINEVSEPPMLSKRLTFF
jgi:DNA-directed RNA polymerase alpha subunit